MLLCLLNRAQDTDLSTDHRDLLATHDPGQHDGIEYNVEERERANCIAKA
jgi:hypothetical protein